MGFSSFLLDFRSLGGVSLVTLEEPLKGVRGVRARQKSTRTEREAGRDMRARMRGKETHVAAHSLLWPTFHHVQEKNQIGKVPFLAFVKLLQNIKKPSQKASGLGLSPILPEGLPISVTSLRGNKRKTLWRGRVVATHWPSETTSHRFPPLFPSQHKRPPPKKVSSGSDGNGRSGGGGGRGKKPLVAIPPGK